MFDPSFMEKLKGKIDPKALADLKAIFLFKLTGQGNYYLHLESGKMNIITEGDKADLTLEADPETWNAVLKGELAPQVAFMTGKLSIDGDMPLAIKLAGLLQK